MLVALALAGCASGLSSPPGDDITLRVDGRSKAVWTLEELTNAETFAIQQAFEGSAIGDATQGRSGLFVKGSTSGSAWDYGLTVSLVWDNRYAGPEEFAAMLADPARSGTIRLRLDAKLRNGADSVRDLSTAPGGATVTLEALEAVEGRMRARGSFSGEVCAEPDESFDGTVCRTVEGTFDVPLRDDFGAASRPAILL